MNPEDLKKIDFIKKIPQHQQKSDNWLNQRKTKLTSSDAGTALGLNPYQKKDDLVFAKNGYGKPYTANVATNHGNHYESVAIDLYCSLMGKTNYEFGLIEFESINPIRRKTPLSEWKEKIGIDLSFAAGSPDGIAIDNKGLEPLIMLEIKCPYRRNIQNGKCPEYYLPQVLLNMFILDLDKADFIEYIPPSPDKPMPSVNIVRIHQDPEWIYENVPKLYNVWQEIVHWQTVGITNHPEFLKHAYDKKTGYKLKTVTRLAEKAGVSVEDYEKPTKDFSTYVEEEESEISLSMFRTPKITTQDSKDTTQDSNNSEEPEISLSMFRTPRKY